VFFFFFFISDEFLSLVLVLKNNFK